MPIALCLAVVLAGSLTFQMRGDAQAQPPATQPTSRPTAQPPVEFEKYHFVVLMRADNPPALSREEAQRIQSEHLGHLSKMHQEGHLLVAGPFGERFDERWRGLCLYKGTLSREEVRRLAESDPAVQAGVMQVALMDWYTEKGVLEFPKSPGAAH